MRNWIRGITGLFAIVCLINAASADDAAETATIETEWLQFRGPRGDGTWHGPKLPASWPAGGPKQIWKQAIGGGYAGISVADGRVITMDRSARPGSRTSYLF